MKFPVLPLISWVNCQHIDWPLYIDPGGCYGVYHHWLQIDCTALFWLHSFGSSTVSQGQRRERQIYGDGGILKMYCWTSFGPVVAVHQTGDYHTQTVTHKHTGSYSRLACQGHTHAMSETNWTQTDEWLCILIDVTAHKSQLSQQDEEVMLLGAKHPKHLLLSRCFALTGKTCVLVVVSNFLFMNKYKTNINRWWLWAELPLLLFHHVRRWQNVLSLSDFSCGFNLWPQCPAHVCLPKIELRVYMEC